MKRNQLSEIKNLETEELAKKVLVAKVELEELVLNKNMRKIKDLKLPSKKRKDIAQMLTILRQKELLAELLSKKEGGK